jgi:DNA-binding GntR family transcriptional regulator
MRLMDIPAQAIPPPPSAVGVGAGLREQAHSALKPRITDADLCAQAEDIRLDEPAVSQGLGVSRTPSREAMTLLEQEGHFLD